ncbi:MAG: hypothetical protein ACKO1F_10790 [Flammeovirgaceae bacterium]
MTIKMTINEQLIKEEQLTHRTATIKILSTAQSKSVAVASIADTHPHATPTHLLSPPASLR